MTTPPLGVYRISKRGDIKEPRILTLEENGNVAVLPPHQTFPKREQQHFTF